MDGDVCDINDLQRRGLVAVESTQCLREAAIKNLDAITRSSDIQLLKSELGKTNEAICIAKNDLSEVAAGEKKPKSVANSETRLKAKLESLQERKEEIEKSIERIEAGLERFEGDNEPGETRFDDLVRPSAVAPFHSRSGSRKRDNAHEQGTIEAEGEVCDLPEVFTLDDGDEEVYNERLNFIAEAQSKGKFFNIFESDAPSIKFEGGYKVPLRLYSNLFPYQRTCLNWLWELYCQKKGGIVGDEMGLGKTVQVASYFAGLHFSDLISKPILIVCPATVLSVWVKEAHTWCPGFRMCVVHVTGTAFRGSFPSKRKEDVFNDIEGDDIDIVDLVTPLENETHLQRSKRLKRMTKSSLRRIKNTLDSFCRSGNIVVTTYGIMRAYRDMLTEIEWEYAVLDEGHQIRNPDAEITIVCKRLRTKNRLILTGTPIQNNLVELWSLYDFIIPGKLGTLPLFRQQFAVPISIGGYAAASRIQAQTAYECAKTLKDLVSPYLLLRLKMNVAKDLPAKEEKILFCRLTPIQRAAYEKFLSEELEGILSGRRNALYGIDILRKICNHPDLLQGKSATDMIDYGAPERSGKMVVLEGILKSWYECNNRVLIFCQTQQMLNIIEGFVGSRRYKYLRMDGKTPVHSRPAIIDSYNNDESIFLFLLSTRVGGIGLNLTGANCVLIYDPDWNPSTDMQAQERAWRIGQKRDVTIYRLLTSGTVEEKVYHRQIFKHILASRILRNPLQNKFFKINDLRDIFTLSTDNQIPDTHEIFNSRDARENQNRDGDVLEDEETKAFSNFFSDESLHTVFRHDKVLEAVKKPIDNVIDEEVSRIAKEALKSVQLSSKRIREYPGKYVPTWTGYSGIAGRPRSPPRSRASPGSTSESDVIKSRAARTKQLLTSIHAAQSNSVLQPSSGRSEQHAGAYFDAIKNRIFSLFSPHTESCLTSDIVRAIGPHLNETNTRLVKKALKEIAVFSKDERYTEGSGSSAKQSVFKRRGVWKLREPGNYSGGEDARRRT